MRIMHFERLTSRTIEATAFTLERDNIVSKVALALILALAAALRFANLNMLGYANSYYAAGVESMLQSWHNFFFVAAEPGGSVSIDKPPVGFWLQAVSAHFIGVNSLGLLLPQIVAGLISVMLLYHLVRRSFGTVAGLLAALALAITPVVVATDRNNTIDSTLILTLLLAAWAFIVAAERGKLRYLLLGAALVGIGFNIKMLQAYLPLPAFFALYFLGSPERLWRKLGNLAIASLLLVVISLSWATIVDLTPASQRPYVGSSGDNSELSLAIGYNGIERLLGMGGRGGLLSGLLDGNQAGNNRPDGQTGTARDGGQRTQDLTQNPSYPQAGPTAAGGFPPAGQGMAGAPPQMGPGGPTGGFGGPGGGGGMFNTGQPGALRLFTQPLSKEASWLLPFGLFSVALLAFRARPRWPVDPKHQALLLWGGWLVTAGIFFSVAGFFHQYYLSMLGAPLAALIGIGTVELWGLHNRRPWVGAALLLSVAAGTLTLQFANARAFVTNVWWMPITAALLLAGTVLLVVAVWRKRTTLAVPAFGLIVATMLVTPGIWSGLTALDPSTSRDLPAAYGGQQIGRGGQMPGPGNGGQNVDGSLLSYLESHTQGTKYLVAVASSQDGSGLVLASGRPVLYMGGFSGQDRVVNATDLSKMVADGELKYIIWNGNGPGGPGAQSSSISAWVTAHGTPVQDLGSQQSGAGAADSASARTRANGDTAFRQTGGIGGTLYKLSVDAKS